MARHASQGQIPCTGHTPTARFGALANVVTAWGPHPSQVCTLDGADGVGELGFVWGARMRDIAGFAATSLRPALGGVDAGSGGGPGL